MKFAKLRLAGFKSFVEPAELFIEAGTTGIVGPNGCGKSNLVEALRWVMGETSARRLRGGEMDDVIFGGTATRPARNVAEVSLTLDNAPRTAPAAFNGAADLQVTRRLARDVGSDYRINGRSVRARDVQLLFADNASGAHSPALVSQGRIGAVISAKPEERRLLLEEAAGIAGLHSRRHEAELRLRAAEANVIRLDDVLRTMEAQFQGLKKQARQAARYRGLSDHIRRAEAALFHLRWLDGEAGLAAAGAAHDAAEARVRATLAAVTEEMTRRTNDAAGLPELRRAEAAAAEALQRLIVAREALDAEEHRVAEAAKAAEQRRLQVLGDLERERTIAADATEALGRLENERQALDAARAEEAARSEAARGALHEARETVGALDRALAQATEEAAADAARRNALERETDDVTARLAALERRSEEHRRHQQAALDLEAAAEPEMTGIGAALDAAEAAVERARADGETAERARTEAEATHVRARDLLQAAEAAQAKLDAEAEALMQVLHGADCGMFPPLLDAVAVAPGFEAAVAAALAEALTAPLDEAAPVHWRSLPALAAPAPLPDGALPLAPHVDAPALARCLPLIGLVASEATGRTLAADLAPGQILVTREGAAWRWDGLTVAAGAPTHAAIRLKQRNRLAELGATRAEAAETTRQAREAEARAGAAAASTRDRERLTREALAAAFSMAKEARERHAQLAAAASVRASRRSALSEAIERLAADRAEAERQIAVARASLAGLPASDAARERIAELRGQLAEQRTVEAERQAALDRLTREVEDRRRRLAVIDAEAQSWRGRSEGAQARVGELAARAEAARAERDRLAERPAAIAAERARLFDQLAEAERGRNRAADALAEAEGRLAETDRRLRQAEAVLAEAREGRVRAEAEVAAARRALADLGERMVERLGCGPTEVASVAGLDRAAERPDAAAIEARLDRLVRERETMGPVNLRAETEAEEIEAQMTSLSTERADLIAAINRLRQGIATLNKEARERLLASFETVNAHFQALFVRLFGGGRAHLGLTGADGAADDPLDAGLEIFACPPGKKLQVLSLLSGGEQALTALALLFAVFLTNPAPICVLDEVDAPLDEANVDRFCSLVEEIARADSTRFLIITHHRMTMARMDRLYGVTMAEQGVSQLVSVDLRRAEELRAAE